MKIKLSFLCVFLVMFLFSCEKKEYFQKNESSSHLVDGKTQDSIFKIVENGMNLPFEIEKIALTEEYSDTYIKSMKDFSVKMNAMSAQLEGIIQKKYINDKSKVELAQLKKVMDNMNSKVISRIENETAK